jgi:hypothetical protein
MKNDMTIDTFGNKSWWFNGKLHREDGPAIEYSSGSKQWYRNGKKHRIDGPACEYCNGDKFWYLNGKLLSEQKFNQLYPDVSHYDIIEEF